MSCGTRVLSARHLPFAYVAVTLYGSPFQSFRLGRYFVTRWRVCSPSQRAPRHRACNACTLTHTRFRLFPVRSPLLGESLLLSFPGDTKMFQFSPFASRWLWIHQLMVGIPHTGCPIRKSPDHGLLAASRGFSQLSTSFIASRRQGIHHVLLVAWPHS